MEVYGVTDLGSACETYLFVLFCDVMTPLADRHLREPRCRLTLKAPITTAADEDNYDIFPNFPKK